MYTLTVTTHSREEKSWNYISMSYACEMFDLARTCEDCAYVTITDAMTGELHKEWSYKDGLTIFNGTIEIHL